jgi:TatD DNase family protein
MKLSQGDFVVSNKKEKKHIPLPELQPGSTLIDTHCHLDMDHYDGDQAEVIERAVKSGIARLITVGIDIESSRKAIELAGKFESVFATVGVHPHNVENLSAADYEMLADLARQDKVVAYGEIGMDLVKDYAPVDQQEIHFKKQLQLAKELNLPVIIHDREAHEIIMAALHEAAPFAQKVIDLGFYISIPGVVTFNKAEQLHEAVKNTPLTSLLLETDAPFLAPVPKRGKRNEPVYTLYTAAKVAALKGVSIDAVARQTTENAMKLFNL